MSEVTSKLTVVFNEARAQKIFQDAKDELELIKVLEKHQQQDKIDAMLLKVKKDLQDIIYIETQP